MTAAIAPIDSVVVWENESRITTHQSWDAYPSILQTEDDRVWFVWQSDRGGDWTFDIYYVIYDYWFHSWSVILPLTTDPSHDITPSLMVTNDGTIWIFWSSMRTGNYDLFFKTSSDNGYTWTNATQLTTNVHNDESPSIAQMQDGRIWVVWQYANEIATETNFEIFYKTYNESWSSATPLVENPDFDWDPSIMQSRDGMIWMFWSRELYRGGPDPYQDDLFYKTSDDNGATWTEDIPLIPDEDWNEGAPSAVHASLSSDKKLWLTWHSDKNDNFDLYYMKTNVIFNRDVAITDVTPASTMVYQNQTVSINVTAENQGEMSGPAVEVVTVDCYVNTTLIGSEVVGLHGGESTVIVFSWNTSNFAFGPYTISANASAVPTELPINLVDNTYIDGTVLVTIICDINGDGAVDRYDAGIFAGAFGTSIGHPDYDPRCDFNNDESIDRYDGGILSQNYGRTI